MQTRKSFWYSTAILTALAAGCNDQTYDLAPVSGTVTLDGEPLTTGVVQFQPVGGEGQNPGPGSAGLLDAEGRFELQTQTSPRENGAVVGTHLVRIYSRNPESPTSDVDTQPSVELVPQKYNFRTELTFDVPAEGKDDADFSLTTTE